MSVQESFEFKFEQRLHADEFVVSACNEEAFAAVNHSKSDILLIYGSEKSGKSILAGIWQVRNEAIAIAHSDIGRINIEAGKSYIIKDVEKILDEKQFLHIFNNIKEMSCKLLMTSAISPNNINFSLPDLKSRLNAVNSVAIEDPDDNLISLLLAKKFSDKQLRISPDVITYIKSRINRSYNDIYNVVDKIDRLSMVQKRNITIPMVKAIIG